MHMKCVVPSHAGRTVGVNEGRTRRPIYHFGNFILDLERGALLPASGSEVSLRPKAFSLLHLFVENAGRLSIAE